MCGVVRRGAAGGHFVCARVRDAALMRKKRNGRAPLILQSVLESVRPTYDAPLTVRGSFLFLSDIEIPFHHADFINQVMTVAKLYGIRQAVYCGDFIHLEALSPFPGADTDVEQELSEIDEYLPGFLEPFTKIIYLMGNHDQRAQRLFDRKISNDKALRMILSPHNIQAFYRKVTMSEYFWCRADGNWLLEHQKNNSTIPTRVAQSLSAKFHCNVITAHTHKAGAVRTNGFWAIDSGCAVDTQRLAYPNLRHSTHTEMQNGAVLMIQRRSSYVPILLTPDRMEFELWRAKRG